MNRLKMVAAVLLALSLVLPMGAAEAESVRLGAEAGYGGTVLYTRNMPISVSLENLGADFAGVLSVDVYASEIDFDRYEAPVQLAAGAAKRVVLPVTPGYRQEEFLDLVLRPVINTDDEHARLQLERLFVSARDEFLINNMLYMAGDDPEALFSRIKKLVLLTQNTQRDMRHTLSLLDKILYQAKRRAQDPDLWDAVITYEVIKLSYGNSCDTWCCKQVGVTGVEKIIKNAARRLEHVGIENKDFRQLIPLYDRPNALMYLDPPYYKAEDFYLHAGQFNEQSHRDLHDLALHMEGHCLLSYNGCDFIRDLYSESKFYQYEFVRSNNLKQRYDAGSQFPEILIANYDMDEVIANKREQLTLF